MKSNTTACRLGMTLAASLALGSVYAGPVIIDGTDANDHGSFSAGANQTGWLYMQKVLENLSVSYTGAGGANLSVTVVGIQDVASQARNAIASAFSQSSLSGWTINYIDGATDIGTLLSGGTVGSVSLANTGILHLASANNSTGDMDSTELAVVNSNAASIASYVAGGGALWSMAESGTGAYGWLSTLIPGIGIVDAGSGGNGSTLSMTLAGNAAFPGLNNSDLSSGPWHNYFTAPFGSLGVLATENGASPSGDNAVILGGGAGTTISVPEPSTYAAGVALAGFLSYGFLRRRQAGRK